MTPLPPKELAEIRQDRKAAEYLNAWPPGAIQRVDKLLEHIDALKEIIREARNHQTTMGSSFTDWYNDIQEILGRALYPATEQQVTEQEGDA